MSPRKLERAVARATGETLAEIRRRGFSVVDPAAIDFDPEPTERSPQIVNWDELAAHRVSLFP